MTSLKISHTTTYHYDEPVIYALQKLRLRPQSNPLQDVLNWDVEITGGKIETSYRDHYGNHVDLISATPGVTELVITASGEVVANDKTGVLGCVYGCAPLWHFLCPTDLTETDAAIVALADIVKGAPDTLSALHALSAAILNAVPYRIGETTSDTTAAAAIQGGAGVCQDHSHIFIAAAREAGIPARYVSGYLRMTGQVDQDASHAWAEVHIDGLGWVGFDVSNGVSPDANYVRIAIGRDARDATPISGVRMGQGDESMVVTLQVQQ